MERYIWNDFGDGITDPIIIELEDNGDSYTDKDYLGPVIGYVYIGADDSVFFDIYGADDSTLLERKSREKKLYQSFKQTFGVSSFVKKDFEFYAPGIYDKVSAKFNLNKNPEF